MGRDRIVCWGHGAGCIDDPVAGRDPEDVGWEMIMWAHDEDGKPVEIKIEYRLINPFLVDGVEVITKKEQQQLEEVQRRMAKKIGEHITDLLMGGGQPDPAPREIGTGYLGVVRDGKDIA